MGSYVLNGNNFPKEKALIYGRNADGTENKSHLVSYASRESDEHLVIPQGVKIIDGWMFTSLMIKTVQFPEGLEEIRRGAFYANNLANITLPESLKTVDSIAF